MSSATCPLDLNTLVYSCRTHSISLSAEADPALLTVPTSVTGTEDSEIAIPSLSATQVDTDNSEVMSVTIGGLPSGSLLSDGQNNGDGSWLVPVDSVSTLKVTPPLNFAGTMNLALNAYSLELSNGDEAVATEVFTVEVLPVADSFLIVADDVSTDTTGNAALDLHIRLLDVNGDSAGELPAEILELTFGGLPTGARILPGLGGNLHHSLGGATFTGSEDQANNLFVVTGPGTVAGEYQISISGITIDSSSQLADSVLDSFRLTVVPVAAAGQSYTGTTGHDIITAGEGNDIINGGLGDDTITGGGGNDDIVGGPGLDTMTGGGGSDIFRWTTADLGSLDRINDFETGFGGDILDLHALWDNAYDLQYDNISSFVSFSGGAGGTILSIDVSGTGSSFQQLVFLEYVTGETVETMLANGNIIV